MAAGFQALAATGPSDADLAALGRAIAGEVVVPGSPGYDAARRPPIARFHDVRPRAVVRCRAVADVVETLALVRRARCAVAIRSGGHCFAGRSSTEGVLIDVSPLDSVSARDGLAVVGAGARLAGIYDALEPHGVTVAAGCGPGVGISGLALGGGLGILGRRHGLTSDQLIDAEVVLADGRVVTCGERREPDLFWALRGAGGAGLGVVTRLTLRTVPAEETTTVHLTWPVAGLPQLLTAWQEWAPDAADAVAVSLLAVVPSDLEAPASVHAFGAVLVSPGEAQALVDGLVARVGIEPAAARFEQAPYREAKRLLAAQGPGEQADAHVPQPSHVHVKSEFFRRSLPADAIEALAAHLTRDRAAGQARTLDLSPWAGAYNRVPPDATAFVHRAERFLLKHDVAVDAGASEAERRAAVEWLARSWSLVHPWGSGGAYPNFPDPELDDPPAAYYGANRPRVQRVKAAYDPDGVFHRDGAV
jgi:FAD/FMN-containing dehydrogenase